MSDKKAENTGYENAVGWAILLLVLAALIWLIWHVFNVEIRSAVRWIRYAEMWAMSWFIGDDYEVMFNKMPVNWHDAFETVPRFTPEKLNYTHMAYFGVLALAPMRYIFMFLLGLGGFWTMFYGPGTHNRQKLDLEGLIKRQAPNFPVILPFVEFNPTKQPPRPPGSPVPAELPLFAEALGPEEWLAYNEIPVPDGKINEAAATEAFVRQLGGRWRGPTALPPHQQILLATFCLKASRKRREADAMLGRLAKCWTKSGLRLGREGGLLREARGVLKDSKISGTTLALCNRHAYVTTALLRALATARQEGGVLAPAQFVWLRGHERALWYPLNNLGRQSYHPEAMGAMAHFKAERLTQRPIPVPKVQDAIKTIREYMASTRARPIPQLDYSHSKRRGVKMAR